MNHKKFISQVVSFRIQNNKTMSSKKGTKNNDNQERPWDGVPDVKVEWIHHWAPANAMDCKNWPFKDLVQAKVDISFDLPYEVSTANELLYNGKIPTNNPPPYLNKKCKSNKRHKSNKKTRRPVTMDYSSDDSGAPPPPPPPTLVVKYADPTTKNVEMIAHFQESFGGAAELLTQGFEICLMIAAGLVMPEPLTTKNNVKANVNFANNLFALVAYDFAKGAIGYQELPPRNTSLGQWKKSATTLEVERFDRFVNLLEKCFGPQSKKGKNGMDVLATDTKFALSIFRSRPESKIKGIEDIVLVNFRDHNKQSFQKFGMLSAEYCYYKTREEKPLPKECYKAIYYPLGKIYYKLMPKVEPTDIKESLLYLTENQRNDFKANEKWYKTVSSGRLDCNKDAEDDDNYFVAKAGQEIISINSDSTEEEVDVTTI